MTTGGCLRWSRDCGARACRLSVVVPTYERAESLRHCLVALEASADPGHEILVVRRVGDEAAVGVLRGFPDVRAVTVNRAGQVAAMRAGADAASGDVIAFTDDDAVPRKDWMASVLAAFDDPAVGVAGGRDVVHPAAEHGGRRLADVGRLTRWGKLVGNHHLGVGPMRRVDVVKGANMAFRREALAFPDGLRGRGAQVHQEVSMCLWARQRGWRLIYDPSVVVDHYPAPRSDEDQREDPAGVAVRDAAYNYVISLLSFERRLLIRRAAFGLLMGDRSSPGLGRALVASVRREYGVARRLLPSLLGQVEALADLMRGRRLDMIGVGSREPLGDRE